MDFMNEAARLLNFQFNPAQFVRAGSHVLSRDTERTIQRARAVFARVGNDASVLVPPHYPEDRVRYVLHRFLQFASEGIRTLEREFNRRDARILACALTYSQNGKTRLVDSNQFPVALELLARRCSPKNRIVNVLRALLERWDLIPLSNRQHAFRFLKRATSEYDGHRPVLSRIKDNIAIYTDHNGPAKHGAVIASQGQDLASVFNILPISNAWRGYRFFGWSVVAYTETVCRSRRLSVHLDAILTFLRESVQVDVTQFDSAKRCMSTILLAASQTEDPFTRNRTKDAAMDLIGDPTQDYRWAPWKGATSAEVQQLKKARAVLNEWLTSEFIHIFFEKVVDDRARRDFWRKLAGHIRQFRIYGSESIRHSLLSDDRIGKYVEHRFGYLRSSTGGLTALVMRIQDRVFVEFSHHSNVLSVYNMRGPGCPDIAKKRVTLSDLKLPSSTGKILYVRDRVIYDIRSEGRFIHSPDWERHLARWFSDELGVNIQHR